MQAAQSRQDR